MQSSKNSQKKQLKAKARKNPQPKAGNVPASYARPQRAQMPFIARTQSSDGKITVRNREYVADVKVTQAFSAKAISINPGLVSTFPWLGSIANSYEFYHFKRLSFEYEPTCGTQTAGSVMLAVDFDAADAVPATKQRIMSYMSARVSSAYQRSACICAGSNLSKAGVQKYTRPGDVPVGKDVKTYDVGNLIMATDSGDGSASGMLFASYEVELMTPHAPEEYPYEASAKMYSSTCSKANPLAGSVVQNADAIEPVLEVASSTDFILKKAGQYMLDLQSFGTGLTNAMLHEMLTAVIAGSATIEQVIYSTVLRGDGLQANTSALVTTAVADVALRLAIPVAWTTFTTYALRASPYKHALG